MEHAELQATRRHVLIRSLATSEITLIEMSVAEGEPLFTEVHPPWLRELDPSQVEAVKGFENHFVFTQTNSGDILIFREKTQSLHRFPVALEPNQNLDLVPTHCFHKEILLLDKTETTLRSVRVAVDLPTSVKQESVPQTTPPNISITTTETADYLFMAFKNENAKYRRYKLLVNMDAVAGQRLKIYEHFLLGKGNILWNFCKLTDGNPLASFFRQAGLQSFHEVTLLFESGIRFIQFLEVAGEFPMVRRIVLHNLHDADYLAGFFQTFGALHEIPRTTEIFVINQTQDPFSRPAREFLGFFKERNPHNVIFYHEYEGEAPHIFGSLLVSLLG